MKVKGLMMEVGRIQGFKSEFNLQLNALYLPNETSGRYFCLVIFRYKVCARFTVKDRIDYIKYEPGAVIVMSEKMLLSCVSLLNLSSLLYSTFFLFTVLSIMGNSGCS